MLALLFLLIAAAPLDVRFSDVVDGDTFKVLNARNVQQTIRLTSVDAPELGQPYGGNAKAALLAKLSGKILTVEPKGTDHDRILAHVVADGIDVNQAMVADGLAWWSKKSAPKDTVLEAAENEARAAGKGLWADPGAVAPWDWRRTATRSRKIGRLESRATTAT